MADGVQGIVEGTTVSFEKTVTTEDIAKFTEVSGDTNPLHSDPDYAARTRFKEPIRTRYPRCGRDLGRARDAGSRRTAS